MKLWCLGVTSLLSLWATAKSADLATTDGMILRDALVVSVEEHHIVVWHESGESVIECGRLPEELQKQYCEPIAQALPDELILQDGTTLQKPVLKKVDQEGITVTYASGAGRVSYKRLPGDLRARFPFTEATLSAYRKMKDLHEFAMSRWSWIEGTLVDGKWVPGHERGPKDPPVPELGWSGTKSGSSSGGGPVNVRGYTRQNGTQVSGYSRQRSSR